MSVFLIATSFITTLLIPAEGVRARRPGQRPRARLPRPRVPGRRLRHGLRRLDDRHPVVRRRLRDGRPAQPDAALPAPLRHGPALGPRGAPDGASSSPSSRFLVTWIFDADVDAQGGAYATGVLVLITSAAIAVTIAARKAGQRGWTIGFGVISAVFLYTTVVERHRAPRRREDRRLLHRRHHPRLAAVPAGPRLRAARHRRRRWTTWRNVSSATSPSRKIRFIANEPDRRDIAEYRDKIEQIRADNDIPDRGRLRLRRGHRHGPLRVRGRPDAYAARCCTAATAS